MTDTLPFTHPFCVAELAGRKPTRFRIAPDAEARAHIAEWLGIVTLPEANLAGTLTPKGRSDWVLEADLGAEVVQECIITLAPVTTRITERVERRYLAEMPEPAGDEVEIPEDVSIEPLGQVIDPGAVLLEALELALPLYPRAPGAELGEIAVAAPGAEPLTDVARRPFAGLADLLGTKRDDEGGAER